MVNQFQYFNYLWNYSLKQIKSTFYLIIHEKNTLLILLLVVSGLQAQVCVWNFKNLKNVKQTNPDAVKVVIKAADKEFEKSITTVMNKFLTPGSGDKHDYMSMGRYWWPDPTKPDVCLILEKMVFLIQN